MYLLLVQFALISPLFSSIKKLILPGFNLPETSIAIVLRGNTFICLTVLSQVHCFGLTLSLLTLLSDIPE